jgi:hypothetical protein
VAHPSSLVYFLTDSKTVTYPFLNDAVNRQYGLSATSSICGLTTVTLLDNGATPDYVSVSTSSGSPILTFSSSSSFDVGTYTLTIIYKLA